MVRGNAGSFFLGMRIVMKRLRGRILRLLVKVPEPLRSLLTGSGENGRDGAGALFSFGIRVGSAVIAFVAQVLLARWLGAFDFGIYTFVWVWVNVLGSITTLGLSIAAVRFLAEYATRGDDAHTRGFLNFGRFLTFTAGAIVAALGIAVLYAFGPRMIDDHYIRPLIIGLLSLPAIAVTDFQDGVGRARSWIAIAFIPPYIMRPLLILGGIGLILLFGGPRTATVAAIALTAASWLTMTVQYIIQQRRFGRELKDRTVRYRPRQWLSVALPMLLMDSFALLMLNLDVMLLERFVPPDKIAVYFAAARTITLIAFIHFAVTAVAMPRFAASYAERDSERAMRQLARFRSWMLWPSLAAATFILVLGKWILALFGPEFPVAWPLMFILALGYIARAAAGPAESMLVVSGHQNYTALITGVAAFVNATLNLALIPHFGLTGAALATSIAYTLQAAFYAIAANRVLAEGFGHAPPPPDGAKERA